MGQRNFLLMQSAWTPSVANPDASVYFGFMYGTFWNSTNDFYLLLMLTHNQIHLLVASIAFFLIMVQVRVCREKATGHVYAMKKLKKSEMLRRGQV